MHRSAIRVRLRSVPQATNKKKDGEGFCLETLGNPSRIYGAWRVLTSFSYWRPGRSQQFAELRQDKRRKVQVYLH
jgi:hypothetical protein